ncbi:hypothetical protein [Hydrogenophaga sp.]|uniref:hypothetical protein n=1 Tax=Hydrogenophaga sp. TaxID=1904254 RepID=UPI002720FF6D|nr:hypothetical protein [Hydrogenophaga sp.]MDO8902935.1 hypothetical protein [Hydrogenophaga sp.]
MTDQVTHLRGQCLVLAGLLENAVKVVQTIEPENSDEEEQLQAFIDRSNSAVQTVLREHAMQPSHHLISPTTTLQEQPLKTQITIAELPAIGETLEGGIFAGLTTKPDGTHCAAVLLPAQGTDLNWKAAKAWAGKQDGELPSRPVAALLFANLKEQLRPNWHWTADGDGASYAWSCNFGLGGQSYGHKSYEGSAVAVRLIHLTA